MSRRTTLIATTFMLFARSGKSAENPRELARECLEAVSAITSYDVKMEVTSVTYPSALDPEKPNDPLETMTLINRDVLAWGYGRRVERSVGTPEHHVAVKMWGDALNGRKGLAIGISYTLGQDYIIYFNQNCFGLLLSQILADTKTSVNDVPPNDNQLRGFELLHPNLQAPVRVWVDPAYGYLPVIIEKDTISDGKPVLYSRSQVDEFMQVADSIWVPVRGSHTRFSRIGPSAVRAVSGSSMVVLTEESSWNAISSDELFVTASIPEVNHEMLDWKQHLPPAMLAAMEPRGRTSFTEGNSRTLLIIVNVLVIICVIAFVLAKKHMKKKAGKKA